MIDAVLAWAQTLSVLEALGIGGGTLIGGIVLVRRAVAFARRIFVRFVVRHSVLAAIGITGLSLEAVLPDGVAGVIRWALSLIGVGG